MPDPFGRDTVEARGAYFVLTSPYPKGWSARREKTIGRAEHPGTAIEWDQSLYEVLAEEVLPKGRMRYVLGAWDDRHVIRLLQHYSSESEVERERLISEARRRERWGWGLYPFFALLGHLPASVQMGLESEYGLAAYRITLVSVAPLLLLGSFSLIWTLALLFSAGFGMSLGFPIPAWALLLGCCLLVESLMRMGFALSTSRPVGSPAGVIVWTILDIVAPGKLKRW